MCQYEKKPLSGSTSYFSRRKLVSSLITAYVDEFQLQLFLFLSTTSKSKN